MHAWYSVHSYRERPLNFIHKDEITALDVSGDENDVAHVVSARNVHDGAHIADMRNVRGDDAEIRVEETSWGERTKLTRVT